MIFRSHRFLIAVLSLTALSTVAPTPTFAQSGSQAEELSPAALASLPDFIDGVLAQQIATREVAGAVVTVVKDRRVILSRGYGFADVEQTIPVDPERTLFRPGSVSKLFTWVALMQQIERGAVDLDADVNTYLDFSIPPFEGKPITVRDLFQHTLGMSDVGGISTPDPDKLVPYGTWLKTHVPQRVWAPGTEISYSNFGAALAGYIVELVSGEPFADYTERHIFRPLRMTSTTFREHLPAEIRSRSALGYKYEDGRFVAQPLEYYGVIMPAGSASAPGSDMSRFMLAMLGGGQFGGTRILTRASTELLMSDSVANAPGLEGMAHGFMVHRQAGPRLVGHGGNTRDFHSNLVLAPDLGLGFYISMTGGQGSYGARTELTEAIIGRLFPREPAPRHPDASPRAGDYQINRRDHGRPVDPARYLKVSDAGLGALKVEFQGQTSHWQAIGTDTYERVTGARAGGPFERMRFYGGEDAPRLSFSSQPHVTYHLVRP
jgi:CubicO group peptidase (beta-lactamase class C family)